VDDRSVQDMRMSICPDGSLINPKTSAEGLKIRPFDQRFPTQAKDRLRANSTERCHDQG